MAQGICLIDGCEVDAYARGWCRSHYMHWWHYDDPLCWPPRGVAPMPVEDRFWPKVVERENGCWEWLGRLSRTGYGQVRMNEPRRTASAHRVAYELVVGKIPPGLTIDHLCRNPPCVNPAHLEPVSNRENVRRGTAGDQERSKTHCPQGHPYDEINTYYPPSGHGRHRACRECRRIDNRERKWAARRLQT